MDHHPSLECNNDNMPPQPKGKSITNLLPIEIATEAVGTDDGRNDSSEARADQNHGNVTTKRSSSSEGAYHQTLSTKASTTRPGKRMKTTYTTREDKERKQKLRAANCRSKFRSRQRHKALVEELRTKVLTLAQTRDQLKKTNEQLRSQLEVSMYENQLLREQSLGLIVVPSSSQFMEQSVAPQVAVQPPIPSVPSVFLDGNNRQEEASFPLSVVRIHPTSQSSGLSNQMVQQQATNQLISQCESNSDSVNTQPVSPQNLINVQNQNIPLSQQLTTSPNQNDNQSTNLTISLGNSNVQHQLAVILALLTGQAVITSGK